MSFFYGLASVLLVQAFVASIAVWGYWLHQWSRGRSPIRWQPREPVPWGGGDVAFAAVFYLAIQIAVAHQLLPAATEAARLTLVASVLSNGLVLLLLPGLLIMLSGSRWADFGLRRVELRGDLFYGLVGLLAAMLPVLMVQFFAKRFFVERVHAIIEGIQQDPTPMMWVLAFVSAVVFAPLAEEFLFRVVLQGWLEKRLHPALAIAGSSVTFAAMHSTSWPDPLPLLPLAGVLGYVYYRRHSLLAPVVLHASFNAVNLVILGVEMSEQATGAV